MEYKSAATLIKTADLGASKGGGWRISGYLTKWGDLDVVGDITVKGAFRKSIAAGNPVLLFGHDYESLPIGKILAWREDEKGVFFTAQLAPTTAGADLKALIDIKAVTGVSYGYNVGKSDYTTINGKRVRRLLDVDVKEVSLTPFPALPSAQLLDSGTEKDQMLISEYETLKAAGIMPTRKHTQVYIDAAQRELERLAYDGLTRQEWRDKKLREIDRLQNA